MNDYPLRVKIVASIAIVLAYVIGGPIYALWYFGGYLADRLGCYEKNSVRPVV
jgi:hypothetical protein